MKFSDSKEPTKQQWNWIEAEAYCLMAEKTNSVQKACQLDQIISQPKGFINYLKRKKVLDPRVEVKLLPYCGKESMTRSALVGISFDRLLESQEAVESMLRMSRNFTLPPNQYFRAMQQMVAHAQQHAEYQEVIKDPLVKLQRLQLNQPHIRQLLRNNCTAITPTQWTKHCFAAVEAGNLLTSSS